MMKTIMESLREMFPPGAPLEFSMDMSDINVEGIQPLCVATYNDGAIIVCAFWNFDRRKMWAWRDGELWQVSEKRPPIVDQITLRQAGREPDR